MARKSNAQIALEAEEKQAEIRDQAKALVQDMLPGIMAALVTQLTEARTGLGAAAAPANTASDRGLIEGLASAIVKAGDPKNVNRTLDPQVAAQRKVYREKMIEVLVGAHARGEKPIYQLRATMWLNDTLCHPQWRDEGTKQFRNTEIQWDRVPNEGMIPMNDLAKEVFELYRGSIGSVVVEGMPDAPWLNPEAPWVFSKEGIVRGMPIAAGEVGTGAGFDDPRRPGHSSVPANRELSVLGNSPTAPKVIEQVI